MSNFLTDLEAFRKNRGLENELGDIVTYTSKELNEAREAHWKDDIDNLIEELCDICVYSFNGIAQLGSDDFTYYKNGHVIESFDHLCCNLFSILANMSLSDNTIFFSAIINNCSTYIEKLGYNFELAMNETVKKINSRDGAMNELTGKWEKDPLQDKSTLYIPNYKGCLK